MDELEENRTKFLVPLDEPQQMIGCKWIFKTKLKFDGSLEICKACLMARGFYQISGIDYSKTFSLIVKPTMIRLILTLTLHHYWPIKQLDVNNAFLN